MAKKTTQRKSVRKAPGHLGKSAFSPYRIFFLLGLSAFLGGVMMVVIFVSERAGTMPWLGLTYIEGITEAENMLFFVATIIFGFFLAFLLISLVFRFNRRDQ